jgi:hypothetical protein
MAWTSTLAKPLRLRDGRELKTLADVREIFIDLPRSGRSRENWRDIGALLMKSAAKPDLQADLQSTLESYLDANRMI